MLFSSNHTSVRAPPQHEKVQKAQHLTLLALSHRCDTYSVTLLHGGNPRADCS
jgi:hypothetical protein